MAVVYAGSVARYRMCRVPPGGGRVARARALVTVTVDRAAHVVTVDVEGGQRMRFAPLYARAVCLSLVAALADNYVGPPNGLRLERC